MKAANRVAVKSFALLREYYSVFLVLCLWELVAHSGMVREALFPPVSIIFKVFVERFLDGYLLKHMISSLLRAVAGLSLGVVVGVVLGLAMARSRFVNWAFEMLVAVGFPVPKVALIPLFLVWFGIGHQAKIYLVAYACMFPMLISTFNGARAVPRPLLWSSRSLGTSERKLLYKVIFPASLPFIFNGLRVALPTALIIVFLSEMVAGGGGLGFVLRFAIGYFETPTEFAGLFTIVLLGYGLDRILLYVRRMALQWHAEETHYHAT